MRSKTRDIHDRGAMWPELRGGANECVPQGVRGDEEGASRAGDGSLRGVRDWDVKALRVAQGDRA